jgi:hypothetical protein
MCHDVTLKQSSNPKKKKKKVSNYTIHILFFYIRSPLEKREYLEEEEVDEEEE